MSYNKCLVNIEKEDEKIIADFSKLHESFKTWLKDRDDNLSIPSVNIIKYIVYCYDYESDIVREHRSRWTVKKREAAKLSGILYMRDQAGDGIDEVLYCKNTVINRITVRYLALLSDRDYMMYAIYNEMLVNQSIQMLAFDFDKPTEVAKAKANIEQVQEDIQKLEQKLFSGDDVRALKNILQEETSKFLVSELRPENLVSKHEKKEMVVDSPYGRDFPVPDLRFIDDK